MPIWKAPEDFKPHFLEVKIKTDKDGLLSNMIKATRFTGKYDPQAPDKKKADLSSYDVPTLVGIMGRLSGATFKASVDKIYPVDVAARMETMKLFDKEGKKVKDKEGKQRVVLVHRQAKRLPPQTQFTLLLRIGKRAKDDALTTAFKFIKQHVKKSSGVVKAVELDKKDPAYRAIRKSARTLPAAFRDVQQPPKPVRGGGKKKKDEDSDD